MNDLYSALKKAGFTNITKEEVDSGWLEAGKVVHIAIDDSENYGEAGRYVFNLFIFLCYRKKYGVDLILQGITMSLALSVLFSIFQSPPWYFVAAAWLCCIFPY